MENIKRLSEIEEITEDVIPEIKEILESVGVTCIKEAMVIPSKTGVTVKVTDSREKNFYVGLSDFGFVEIVREDSEKGKIIYIPIDEIKF